MKRILLICALLVLPNSAYTAEKWRGTNVAALTPPMQARLAKLKYLHGPRLAPATFRDKIVVVTFFASWCPPCHVEFKHLKTIHAKYAKRGVRIIAINWFQSWEGLGGPEKLQIFLERYDPPFAVVEGDKTTVRDFGNVTRIPTLLVFARDGKNGFHFVHRYKAKKTHVTLEEMEAAIKPLL